MNGVSFPGLLAIVFITLKVTKYIDWSWWWVLSPLWILAVLVFFALILKHKQERKRKDFKSALEEMQRRRNGL